MVKLEKKISMLQRCGYFWYTTASINCSSISYSITFILTQNLLMPVTSQITLGHAMQTIQFSPVWSWLFIVCYSLLHSHTGLASCRPGLSFPFLYCGFRLHVCHAHSYTERSRDMPRPSQQGTRQPGACGAMSWYIHGLTSFSVSGWHSLQLRHPYSRV